MLHKNLERDGYSKKSHPARQKNRTMDDKPARDLLPRYARLFDAFEDTDVVRDSRAAHIEDTA
jgi:hypothetical protein